VLKHVIDTLMRLELEKKQTGGSRGGRHAKRIA
jgi:hypothetical protein